MERYALLHHLQKQRQLARRMAPIRPLSAHAAYRLRLAEAIGPASGARTVNASWHSVYAEEIGQSEPLEIVQPSLEQIASQAEENEPAEQVAQESAPAAIQELIKVARPQQISVETSRTSAPEDVARPAAESVVLPAHKLSSADETFAEEQRQVLAEQSEERQALIPSAPAFGEQDAPALDTPAPGTPRTEQPEERQLANQQGRPGPRRARIEERPLPVAGQQSDLALSQHPTSAGPETRTASKTEMQREAERESAELFTASKPRSPQEWFALLAQARQQAQPVRSQAAMPRTTLEDRTATESMSANVRDAGTGSTEGEHVEEMVTMTRAQETRANVRDAGTGNTEAGRMGAMITQPARARARTVSAGVASVKAANVMAVRTVKTSARATALTHEVRLHEQISTLNAEELSPVSRVNLDQRKSSVNAEEALPALRESSHQRETLANTEEASPALYESTNVREVPVSPKEVSRNMSAASNVREIDPDPEEVSSTFRENSDRHEAPGPGIYSNGLNTASDDADIDADRARATDIEPVSMQARRVLKPLIGFDPADARIHHGPAAARFVDAQRADAVTLGDDIFLAAGYSNDEPQTLGLLAHELTHVARHHEPDHVPPVVASSPASEPGAQANFAETPQQITARSNGFLVSTDEEELAEQVERQVTHQTREASQAFAPASAARTATPSNARANVARSGWGGLPAPWEPLPDWLASSASTDGFEQRAGTSQTRPSLPSLLPGSGNGQNGVRSNSSAGAAGAKAGDGQAAPVAQRAGLERGLHGGDTQTPRQEPVPPPQSEPEPDLDKLARQVYAVLKRKLDVERRRMS